MMFALFIVEKRRLRGDPITVYSFLKGVSRGGGADLLSLLTSSRTQGNGMKLHQGRFRQHSRKSCFTVGKAGSWVPEQTFQGSARGTKLTRVQGPSE